MKWCAIILLSFLCCYAQAALGGTETSIEDYPYIVQVQYNDRRKCAGIIVDEQNIVSVAHCFFDGDTNQLNFSSFTVRYGTSDLGSGGTVIDVESITIHEDYNKPVRNNDIAVLKLSSPVTLGDNVKIADIPCSWTLPWLVHPPIPTFSHHDLNVTIPSWYENLGTESTIIREYNYSTISYDSCYDKFKYIRTEQNPYIITKNMFCAATPIEVCPGTEGQPIVYKNRVIGMISWGQGCGTPRYPLVNVKLGRYVLWIKHVIKKDKMSKFWNGLKSYFKV